MWINTLINEGCLTYHLLARAMPVRGPVLVRYLCAHSLTYILYISLPAQDLDSKAMRNRERKEREQIEDKAEGTKLHPHRRRTEFAGEISLKLNDCWVSWVVVTKSSCHVFVNWYQAHIHVLDCCDGSFFLLGF